MAHLNIDERRLKIQELMNANLSRREIGIICSAEFNCTISTIYSDLNLYQYKLKNPYNAISGVYSIYCMGGFYIGCSIDIKKRWKQHKRQLRGIRHPNDNLQLAYIESRGRMMFSIILECPKEHVYIEEANQISTFRKNGHVLFN